MLTLSFALLFAQAMPPSAVDDLPVWQQQRQMRRSSGGFLAGRRNIGEADRKSVV